MTPRKPLKRKPPPPHTVPVDVTLLEQMQTLINGIMMYKRRPKGPRKQSVKPRIIPRIIALNGP